jgi:hypothetical protein
MKLLLCAVSLLCAGSLFAAGSVSETRAAIDPPQKITLAWTAALDGTVAVTSQPVRGEMNRVVFVSGTPSPTNATYAVTLRDQNGVDVLAGQGSAIATNAPGSASQVVPGVLVVTTAGVTNLIPVVVNGKLSLAISGVGTNATAGKQGVVIIYVK